MARVRPHSSRAFVAELRQLQAVLPIEGRNDQPGGREVPIHVFCRFRGQQAGEPYREDGWTLNDSTVLASQATSRAMGPLPEFPFERVFGPDSCQEEIFEHVSPIAHGLSNGMNGCVLCYGQTAAGKTFTMEGGEGDSRGLIPRTLELLLGADGMEACQLRISMLEIYMERLRDLLDPDGNAELSITEDRHQGITIRGLSEVPTVDCAHALRIFTHGRHHRAVAATGMNDRSSRSHSIFIIKVVRPSSDDGRTASPTVTKLCLVDLAGSECMKKATLGGREAAMANAALAEEAKAINQSLSTLGLVINRLALSRRQGTRPATDVHVPYRSSKLTRVLQDSLGGASHTALIINCSLSPLQTADTLSTLRFGSRARACVNLHPGSNLEESTLARTLKVARREIVRLQLALSGQTGAPSGFDCSFTEDSSDISALSTHEDSGSSIEISPNAVPFPSHRAALAELSYIRECDCSDEFDQESAAIAPPTSWSQRFSLLQLDTPRSQRASLASRVTSQQTLLDLTPRSRRTSTKSTFLPRAASLPRSCAASAPRSRRVSGSAAVSPIDLTPRSAAAAHSFKSSRRQTGASPLELSPPHGHSEAHDGDVGASIMNGSFMTTCRLPDDIGLAPLPIQSWEWPLSLREKWRLFELICTCERKQNEDDLRTLADSRERLEQKCHSLQAETEWLTSERGKRIEKALSVESSKIDASEMEATAISTTLYVRSLVCRVLRKRVGRSCLEIAVQTERFEPDGDDAQASLAADLRRAEASLRASREMVAGLAAELAAAQQWTSTQEAELGQARAELAAVQRTATNHAAALGQSHVELVQAQLTASKYEAEVGKARAEVAALQLEASSREAEHDKAHADRVAAEDKAGCHEEELCRVRAQLTAALASASSHEAKLGQASEEMVVLQHTARSHEVALSQARAGLATREAEVSEGNRVKQALEQERDAARKDAAYAQDALSKRVQELRRLEEALKLSEEERESHRAKIMSLEGDVVQAEATLKHREGVAQTHQDAAAAAADRYSALADECDGVRRELEVSRRALAEREEELVRLHGELLAKVQECEAARAEMVDVHTALSERDAERTELELFLAKKAGSHEEELCQVRAQLATALATASSHEAQLGQASEEMVALQHAARSHEVALSQGRADLASREAEVSEGQRIKQALEQERDAAHKDAAYAQDVLSKRVQELRSLEEALQLSEEERESHRATIMSLEDQVARAESTLKEREGVVQMHQDAADAASDRYSALAKECDCVRRECDVSRRALADREEKLAQFHGELQAKIRECEAARAEVADTHAALAERDAERAELEHSLAQRGDAAAAMCCQYVEELQAAQRELVTLREKLIANEAHVLLYASSEKEAAETLAALAEERDIMCEGRDRYGEELCQVRAQLTASLANASCHEAQLCQAREEMVALQHTARSHEAALSQGRADLACRVEEMSEGHRIRQALEQERDAAHKDAANARDVLSRRVQKLKSLEEALDLSEKERESHRTTIMSLEGEVARAESTIKESEGAVQTHQDAVDAAAKRYFALAEECDGVRRELGVSRRAVAEREERLVQFHGELQAKIQECGAAKAEMADTHAEFAEREAERAELELSLAKKADAAATKCCQYVDELAGAQSELDKLREKLTANEARVQLHASWDKAAAETLTANCAALAEERDRLLEERDRYHADFMRANERFQELVVEVPRLTKMVDALTLEKDAEAARALGLQEEVSHLAASLAEIKMQNLSVHAPTPRVAVFDTDVESCSPPYASRAAGIWFVLFFVLLLLAGRVSLLVWKVVGPRGFPPVESDVVSTVGHVDESAEQHAEMSEVGVLGAAQKLLASPDPPEAHYVNVRTANDLNVWGLGGALAPTSAAASAALYWFRRAP